MKALSVKQPWASAIAAGTKTIEYRRWRTSYRGQLLICSSRRPVIDGLPGGVALAVARLVDCRDEGHGLWGWVLQAARPIKHFPVTGRLGLFNVRLPDE